MVAQNSFIEAVLREEGDTGVALGEGLRVEFGFGGEAVLGLRTNVLEGDNGRIGGRGAWEGVPKCFTVLGFQMSPLDSGLGK